MKTRRMFKPRHDARTQEVIRRKAVRSVQSGQTMAATARVLGVAYASVHRWVKTAAASGTEALASRSRGRKAGQKRTLKPAQERQLHRWVLERDPQQLKLSFWLWEARAIQELIWKKFKVRMPLRTVQHYLHRWGWSAQRPALRAAEQKPAVVTSWLKEQYPAIAQRARRRRAAIWWADETAMQLCSSTPPKVYAPKGQTPVVRRAHKRFKVSLINAVNNQGKAAFMRFERMKAEVLIDFASRLLKATRQPVVLILDNLAAHKTSQVQEWVKDQAGRIEIHYLPPYSPELNPTEGLNSVAKRRLAHLPPPANASHYARQVKSVMNKTVADPAIIRGLFHQPECRYAA
ncbi:MAG: IS630 family transposase [Blastochloris sp.]|nr:IS630 family transposase [Blastochloris sp.]